MFYNKDNSEYLYIQGRNPVLEALKSNKDVKEIFISKTARGKVVEEIESLASKRGIDLSIIDRHEIDRISTTPNNQGVVALMPPYEYSTIEDILDSAHSKGEYPFIVILDEIEDPQNLGSIIRVAECLGVHGIIIPKRRAAQVNTTVAKVSAGAIHYIPICRVTNIANTIDRLKEQGVWVAGADMQGQECSRAELDGSLALVVGNEGKGLGRLVKQKCDFIISIPMGGHIQSLNASVAAGILIYEVARQRRSGG
ncbi:MAG: 23S rRNA (guanosine(2251)-2'-O)-methyltransferase RlmB [Clostridia bacterium]|nr:23S rRNA (guanosine(2251)-2'-O)-methyltransferase RlmB [Clostridia bacterium]